MLTKDDSDEVCAYLNDPEMASALIAIVRRHSGQEANSARVTEVSSDYSKFEIETTAGTQVVTINWPSPINNRTELRGAFMRLLSL